MNHLRVDVLPSGGNGPLEVVVTGSELPDPKTSEFQLRQAVLGEPVLRVTELQARRLEGGLTELRGYIASEGLHGEYTLGLVDVANADSVTLAALTLG